METQSSPEANALHPIEQAFTQENIEDLRARQHDTLNDETLTEAQRLDTLESLVDEYLGDYSIETSTDGYDDYKQVIRNLSADQVSSFQWRYGEWDEQNQTTTGKTGFDKLHDEQVRLFGRRLDFTTLDSENDNSTNNERESRRIELERDLTEAREKWAIISAKRQGRVLGRGSKDHDNIRDDYQTKVQELAIIDLEEQIAAIEQSDDDDTDKTTQKNATIIGYLFTEQKKLRELTTEKLQGTKVSKFINWFNDKSFSQKLLIGVGVTASATIGGSLLAGAAGAATIGTVIGAGASAGTRFFRGLAMKEKDQRGMATAEEALVAEDGEYYIYGDPGSNQSDRDRITDLANLHNETFEEDTKAEQAKRRKAVYWGLGMVAAGSTLGYGVARGAQELAEMWDGTDLQLWHPFDSDSDSTPYIPNESGSGDDISDGKKIIDRDNDGIADKNDSFVDVNNDGVDDRLNWSDFSPEARTVEQGEGWYQTFEELGIPEENWSDVLNDVGPKLQADGWAYFDEANEEYRVSQPGELPVSALKIIAAGAKRDGVTLAA